MWEMTSWTPNVSEWTVGLNGIIQGAWMGFLFVPLSVTALATLAPEQRTAGAGFFTLARNIGQRMGASATSALLVSNTQENHAEIGSYVTAVNRLFETPAMAHFWSPFTAVGRAALDATITLQAQIIAYIDDFKLLTILTLLALPLVFFFKKPTQVIGCLPRSERGSAREVCQPLSPLRSCHTSASSPRSGSRPGLCATSGRGPSTR
jgi:DHA2 family multidrug resistance protein